MKKTSMLLILLGLAPAWLPAQIPITIRQTDINNGAAIALPLLSARTFVSGYGDYHWMIAGSNFTYSTPVIKIGGSVNGQAVPENQGGTNPGSSFMSYWSPTAIFTNNWISPNSQTLTCTVNWNETDFGTHPYTATLSQAFSFYLVNDLLSSSPTATLSVSPDSLENISRKITDTTYRKMMGIYLSSSTNAVLTQIAFAINNSSTNSTSFASLALYRDSGSGQFSPATSAQLATTAAGGGFATFTGLSENITSAGRLYFLAGQFDPSQQSKNSVISASLNSANVICAYTNAAILTTGGNFLGKQYGFFDATTAEDAAAAAALANQINSAVANGLAGIGPSTTTATKPKWSDAIIPAGAAGAAAIAAAFSSDSLSNTPMSGEFTPQK